MPKSRSIFSKEFKAKAVIEALEQEKAALQTVATKTSKHQPFSGVLMF